MRKYLFIFKSEFMSSLQYVFNIVFGFIGYAVIMFVFFQLWQYLYSNPNELINGYSMSEMIWYVILTEILWSSLGGRKLCTKICNDIKSGNIAYNLCKPYSYIGYALSSHLGSIVIKTVIYAFLGVTLGLLFLGDFPNLSILSIVCVFISSVFALTISTLLILAIGLLSFKIEDAQPFYWLYSKFILIIGTLFPIEFFPEIVRPVLSYSPIFAICYGPAKLFVHFDFMYAIEVLAIQIVYLLVVYIICFILYKKGVKRLNVNGG